MFPFSCSKHFQIYQYLSFYQLHSPVKVLSPLDQWEYWGTVTSGIKEQVGNREKTKTQSSDSQLLPIQQAELLL